MPRPLSRTRPDSTATRWLAAALAATASLTLVACAGVEAKRSHGVAKIPSFAPLLPVTEGESIVEVEKGYEVEPFARGLDLPAGIAFDDKGNAYVIEAGGFLGLNAGRTPPRIVKIAPGGERTAIALKGTPVVFPALGIVWHAGGLFISHRDAEHQGVISRVELDGTTTPIVTGLPSRGDHGTQQIALGPDGKLYFSQGPATTSGVVGLDDFLACAWPQVHPEVHDVPARNLILTGANFLTGDPRGAVLGKTAITGAFEPFGKACEKGEEVKGDVHCNGAILRCDPDGHGLEVFAWGIGHPYGLAFRPDGQVLATCQGMDQRGSRPIARDADALLRVTHDQWYGWPDFSTDLRPLLDDDEHAPPRTLGLPPEPIVDLTKSDVGTPKRGDVAGTFPVRSGTCGLALAPSTFGRLAGMPIVAEMGPLAPSSDSGGAFPGVRVVALDENGDRHELLSNEHEGPASRQGALGRGLERPIDVKFGPDGALYVVDMGVVTLKVDRDAGLSVLEREGTGTIWRVTPRGSSPAPEATPPSKP